MFYIAPVATLLDIITYEGVRYTSLLGETEKQKIRRIAVKLWPLHEEINMWENGKINLKCDGTIRATRFSEKLRLKIIEIASKDCQEP